MRRDPKNPFREWQATGYLGWTQAFDVQSRLDMVASFSRAELEAALGVRGLQKTVAAKIRSRLR